MAYDEIECFWVAQTAQGRARRCAFWHKSGQPKTETTDVNVNCVQTMMRADCWGGVWHCIQRINVRQFLTENSGMRKMFSKIVTRILIEKEKQRQLHYSFDLSNIAVILAGSLPGAESRCFQYEPENKTFAVENKEVFSVETKSAHVARSSWLCLCIFCL